MRVERGELQIGRGDYPTIPEGTTIVSPGEWQLGKREFVAIGVLTGIVVAAHNNVTGDGLLGHFSHVSPEVTHGSLATDADLHTEAFAEALAMIKRLGPPRETDIWIGGAADFAAASAEVDLTIEGERQFAQLALQRVMQDGGIPTERLRTSWNSNNEDLIVWLNSRNGVLLVDHLDNSL